MPCTTEYSVSLSIFPILGASLMLQLPGLCKLLSNMVLNFLNPYTQQARLVEITAQTTRNLYPRQHRFCVMCSENLLRGFGRFYQDSVIAITTVVVLQYILLVIYMTWNEATSLETLLLAVEAGCNHEWVTRGIQIRQCVAAFVDEGIFVAHFVMWRLSMLRMPLRFSALDGCR